MRLRPASSVRSLALSILLALLAVVAPFCAGDLSTTEYAATSFGTVCLSFYPIVSVDWTAPIAGVVCPMATCTSLPLSGPDGIPDLVTTCGTDHVIVQAGLEAGGYQAVANHLDTSAVGGQNLDFALAIDLDGDSVDEVIFAARSIPPGPIPNPFGLMILRPSATTLEREHLETLPPSPPPAQLATISTAAVWRTLSADVDGVNGPDLVYTHIDAMYIRYDLAVHLRSPNGLFDTAAVELTTASRVEDIYGCDVTASGTETLFFVQTPDARVNLMVARLSGPAEAVYAAPFAMTDCACDDFFPDGRNEMLVVGTGVIVLSFSGTEVSASNPPTATVLLASTHSVFDIAALHVHDIDSDGDADLVILNSTSVLVFVQATSGAFLAAPYNVWNTMTSPAPPPAYLVEMFLADVNRDGTLDVVTTASIGNDAAIVSFAVAPQCSADVRSLVNGVVVVQDASGVVNSGTPVVGDIALFACTGNSTLFGLPNATCLASGVWSSDALCIATPLDEITCASGCVVSALEDDDGTTNTTARAASAPRRARGRAGSLTTRTSRARVATRAAADSVIIVLESSAFALPLNKPWVVTLGGDEVLYTISGTQMTLEITATQLRAHGTAGSSMALVVASPRFGYSPQAGGLVYVEFPGAAGCLTEGRWFTNNVCRGCPTGAFCPGGSRIWPLAGYWSPNERTEPVQCSVQTACCGATGERADVCPVREISLGVRDTARCDTSAGFSGVMCEDCEPGFVRDTAQCRRCDAQTTASGEFAGLVLTALVVLGVFFVGLTVAPTAWFVRVVSLMIMFQSFVLLGRQVSSRVGGRSGERLAETFRVLSIVLLDVEFFKPGCFVSRGVRYVDLLYGQLAMALIGLVVAAVAACANALLLRLRGKLDSGSRAVARAAATRFEVGAFSLAAFLVQVNAVRAFQGVACVTEFGARWLVVERSTRCYEGDHARAAPAIWALLVFTVAFPIGCGALLLLAHRRQRAGTQTEAQDVDAKTTGDQQPAMPMGESLAFLLRSVRPERFWFRLIPMVATIVLAALVTNIAASAARIFAGATIVLANAAFVVALVPFKSWRQNLVPVLTALGTGVQVVAILFVEPASTTTERLRGALIALMAALAVAATVRLVFGIVRARKVKANEASGDVELQSAAVSDDHVELPSATTGSSATASDADQSTSSASTTGSTTLTNSNAKM